MSARVDTRRSTGASATIEHDLVAIQAILRRRADDCWDRLEDAATELASLHEVEDHEILRRVMRTLAIEHSAPA